MVDSSLVSVVVGGLLTLGGAAMSGGITLFTNSLQKSAESKKRRADKFEELVAALYEFDHWVESWRLKEVLGENLTIPVSPFAKVQSISSVYFPRFDDGVKALNVASDSYRIWMMQAAQRRVSGDLLHLQDGFAEAHTFYCETRDGLVDALKIFACDEFQT